MSKSCHCDPVCDFCAKRQYNDADGTGRSYCFVVKKEIEWTDAACEEFLCPNCGKRHESFKVSSTVICSICGQECLLKTAHRHQYQYVGDECCWDERLRSSE